MSSCALYFYTYLASSLAGGGQVFFAVSRGQNKLHPLPLGDHRGWMRNTKPLFKLRSIPSQGTLSSFSLQKKKRSWNSFSSSLDRLFASHHFRSCLCPDSPSVVVPAHSTTTTGHYITIRQPPKQVHQYFQDRGNPNFESQLNFLMELPNCMSSHTPLHHPVYE